jgi:hypothetical protein
MTVLQWAQTLASFATFALFTITVTNWLLKSWLKGYLSELKPNGGSSMKDQLNQISRDVTEQKIAMARLEGRFTQHIEESLN